MMNQSGLRFHRPQEGPTDVYRFERRSSWRDPVEGSLTIVLRETEALASLLPARLLDVSCGGAGLMSDRSVIPGSRIALCGGGGGPSYGAVVVRCEEDDDGYHLGVRYDVTCAA
jgi:hypothetical protein